MTLTSVRDPFHIVNLYVVTSLYFWLRYKNYYLGPRYKFHRISLRKVPLESRHLTEREEPGYYKDKTVSTYHTSNGTGHRVTFQCDWDSSKVLRSHPNRITDGPHRGSKWYQIRWVGPNHRCLQNRPPSLLLCTRNWYPQFSPLSYSCLLLYVVVSSTTVLFERLVQCTSWRSIRMDVCQCVCVRPYYFSTFGLDLLIPVRRPLWLVMSFRTVILKFSSHVHSRRVPCTHHPPYMMPSRPTHVPSTVPLYTVTVRHLHEPVTSQVPPPSF